mmetsp:Transcript_18932/g.59257  ORF Transcript_18932/g.59257 Transcript_18932/m.59257 type:complete len:225 (-) Transcript_18932:126-800(-)
MGSVDVSDGGISTAIASVRDDGTDDMYAILKYDGKAKLILQKTGSGSMDEMAGELDDGEVQYVLLRVEGGRDQESKAVKFVFITWVGASVGGMAKGRVASHKMAVKDALGWTVVDIQADDKDDISEEVIREKLKKASGANYDLGSNAGGNYESKAGEIQAAGRNNYMTLEKESNIGPVVFETRALPKETPIDLGGRPMVASATEGKKNTVIRDEGAAAKMKGEE